MIDVFFCSLTNPKEHTLRRKMAELCYQRWREEQKGHVYWINPQWVENQTGAECVPKAFQRERRVLAERMANTDVYVVADDDCLPPNEQFVERAAEMLRSHPEFGILSLWPANCNIYRWTPEQYQTFTRTDEIEEHVSVGGIRFCRKGLSDWPSMNGQPGYDGIQAQALRDAGYRVGYFKNIKMLHLGERRSTVWQNEAETSPQKQP